MVVFMMSYKNYHFSGMNPGIGLAVGTLNFHLRIVLQLSKYLSFLAALFLRNYPIPSTE